MKKKTQRKEGMVLLGCYVPKELRDRIDVLAKAEFRNRSNWLTKLITETLSNHP